MLVYTNVLSFICPEYQPTLFLIHIDPSGRSGLSGLVNANVHWGLLKYLISTTSQPNTNSRTRALCHVSKEQIHPLKRGENKAIKNHGTLPWFGVPSKDTIKVRQWVEHVERVIAEQ